MEKALRFLKNRLFSCKNRLWFAKFTYRFTRPRSGQFFLGKIDFFEILDGSSVQKSLVLTETGAPENAQVWVIVDVVRDVVDCHAVDVDSRHRFEAAPDAAVLSACDNQQTRGGER